VGKNGMFAVFYFTHSTQECEYNNGLVQREEIETI
jgi:hypothetical protein